ncbi:MAG TPA: NADP-dependent oxidoreductase [Burkholderiales bacterium]|nr:NADP-dependent oxidoreductase [Burkholderiales bacterium]
MTSNKAWTLAVRPSGPVTEDNFKLVESEAPRPQDGEVLVRNRWLSLDPYMRFRMDDVKSYAPSVQIGEVMVGQTAGEVIESKHPGFKAGDKVLAAGWQLFSCMKGADLAKVPASSAPLSYFLGVLGMPGLTAYFGLKEIGTPKPGETVVVSAASGAVGSVVGQLAKIAGCRAVGVAGGRQKCDYVVKELGFDACVDYRAGNLYRDLKEACPKGADVYFDNVAGEVLETMLKLMNLRSRIVVCGRISERDEPYCHKNLGVLIGNRIKMQGMIIFDWKDRYLEGINELAGHLAQGKLKYRESVAQGIENAPKAFISMLKGGNFGKQLVKLA